jgi:hypothetical protein
VGVHGEDAGIQEIADRDHGLDLAALSGAARPNVRRQLERPVIELGCNRTCQKRRSSGAHDLATGKASPENLRGKPLGLVSLSAESGPPGVRRP